MCEDYLKKHDIIKSTNMLLIELEKILQLEGYNLEQFKLPTPNHNENYFSLMVPVVQEKRFYLIL